MFVTKKSFYIQKTPDRETKGWHDDMVCKSLPLHKVSWIPDFDVNRCPTQEICNNLKVQEKVRAQVEARRVAKALLTTGAKIWMTTSLHSPKSPLVSPFMLYHVSRDSEGTRSQHSTATSPRGKSHRSSSRHPNGEADSVLAASWATYQGTMRTTSYNPSTLHDHGAVLSFCVSWDFLQDIDVWCFLFFFNMKDAEAGVTGCKQHNLKHYTCRFAVFSSTIRHEAEAAVCSEQSDTMMSWTHCFWEASQPTRSQSRLSGRFAS